MTFASSISFSGNGIVYGIETAPPRQQVAIRDMQLFGYFDTSGQPEAEPISVAPSGEDYLMVLRWDQGIFLKPGAGESNGSHVGIQGGLSIGNEYYNYMYNNGLIVESNVGIGNTNPLYNLDIQCLNASDNPGLNIIVIYFH